jgi:hypothetical protein
MVIVWNYPELDILLKSQAGTVGRDLTRRALKVKAAAQAQVGVKTGALKASIRLEHGRAVYGQQIRVGSDLEYAYMHHEGTRPHVILPQPGGTLRFRGRGGAIVHTTRIDHPGTRPNKYLSDNLYLAIT